MYFDEKLISGILHWRGTPDGKWVAYTVQQLSHKVLELENTVYLLRSDPE